MFSVALLILHWPAGHINVDNAVIDGDIAYIDEDGGPNFGDLLYRKRN